MKNRLLSVIAIVLSCGSLSAETSDWFDAGIAGYTDWPTDNSAKIVEGQGVWTGTENATLVEHRLKVDSQVGASALVFGPAVQKSLTTATLTYSFTTRFSAKEGGYPTIDSDAKCGVSTFIDESEATNYCALVKDPNSTTNIWVTLTGATPDLTQDVNLTIALQKEDTRSYVRYQVGETALTLGTDEWLEIVDASEMTGTVAFSGAGAVAALSAQAESSVPVVQNTLTIPVIDHVTIKHVKVAGVDVEPNGDGVYVVEQGSVVTVTFAPETGWALDVSSMMFVVKTDMELPEAGRPKAIDVAAAITINEVMAKNGTTLLTKTGFEGLDWVELYNRGDKEVDLTGWYFGNDPTKKTSKWTAIEGSCKVPAHGYKILWCDGDKLCKNWAADEAHVEINISTDVGKHTLFLASEANASTIAQQITLPGGIKDISYGLGHLSRTIVSERAIAQYKVGEGEWKEIDGPVGMSAQAGGFTLVSYAVNQSLGNMDAADSCLLNSATWTQVCTNTVQKLAFAAAGTTGSFASENYSDFPDVAQNNFIAVATATVLIPESGDWSFAVGSDDGFSAKLTRLGTTWAWENRGTRGYNQSVANFNLEAGAYAVEIRYFNATGGRGLDFSAAKGRLDFNADTFKLVGTGDVVHAGALGAQVAADVADEMIGTSKTLEWKTSFSLNDAPNAKDGFRLLVKYADGFTARLNGKTVVTVSATEARSPSVALTAESFALDTADLVQGVNTLEITAENDTIDDTEFYLSAQLVYESGDDLFVYFETPTPGAANGLGGRTGFTPKVTFSEPHGYKTASFDLTLSCSDNTTAVIYYTLDGTSPVVGNANTFRYDAPITISKTTVVRAAVPDEDSILQQDASATYLFVEDILASDSTPPEGYPASGAVNGQAFKYGMNKTITGSTDADTQARLRSGFTNGVRTVSLVIDPKHLFDKTSGIYVNASGNGRAWERPVQVEQINPTDTSDEFNVPAGLRIRGAFSRGSGVAKHSFRLFFRSEYGMGTLKHALFGEEGVDEFEKIDFRTEQNYAWSNGSSWETFVHEVFARDSQRDLGQSYNRSRYYHLFINGHYWGLYQTEERVDQNYAESYGGGVADNYDIVRTSQPGYNTGVVEGETSAWNELWRITTQEGYGEGHEANYNLVRGLNPDGARNPELSVYLNVTNLICYMLTSQFAADADSPANSGGMANNQAAYRNRVDDSGKINGFIWNRHDAEHSLSRGGAYNSGTGPLLYGTRGAGHSTALGNFNPAELHYELCFNAEYRKTFADLVYQHILKKGGALTAPVAEARFRARMAELDDAIVCESARWGGSNRTRATWLNNCNDCITFINKRAQYLIKAYQDLGWYPSAGASDVIDGTGAIVEEGTTIGAKESIYLTVPTGATVYYTIDGSDPRTSETAIEYSGASPVPVDVPVIAKGDTWKYYDAGNLPAENWATEAYDDASWSEGKSRLGFGSGSFGTTLAKFVGGASSGTQVTTYYFRKTFEMPENAATLTSLKAALDCDDGYVAYINGVEVGRDQVSSTAYDAFATGLNLGEKDATFTFPAGTLKAGTNVIAVEVHQCNASSSDAWWNLALSYSAPGDVEGGLSVPEKGLTLKIGAFKDDEWGPINTITVKGEEVMSTQAEAVRVLAVYSSTKDAKGDADDEFITLTNITEHAVQLEGLVINAAKEGKSLEALCTLSSGRLEAGAVLTLTKAENWPKGKLTNGIVDMKLVDADGATVQTLKFSSKWFNSAADGTGVYLIAKEFGATVTKETQWKPSVEPAPTDWPEDPDTEITETTTPADLGITEGAFTNAVPTELKKVSKWAKAQSVPFGGELILSMSFDEEGHPLTMGAEAYLLNCAPTEEAVQSQKAAFKFDEIIPGVQPTIDDTGYNGQVKILGCENLGDEWTDADANTHFFKAILIR